MPETTTTTSLTTESASATPSATAPTGILVIGGNRSGTKWLSNILCNHSQVVGLQKEAANGIMETNFFGNFQRCLGDIRQPDHYVALIELMAATDAFRVSGVDKQLFYTQRPLPQSVLQVFRMFVEAYASEQSAAYWLQKTSPAAAWSILAGLPPMKLVSIRRELTDTLASAAQLRRNLRVRGTTVRRAMTFAVEEKYLTALERAHNIVQVRYEDLKRDPAGEAKRVCLALGLAFEPDMVAVRFRPNTSFKPGERKSLSTLDSAIARAAAAVTRCVPFPLLRIAKRAFGTRNPHIVSGTFGQIKQQYGIPD